MINERRWCIKVITNKQQVTTFKSTHLAIIGP
jgi:hypothetical protein